MSRLPGDVFYVVVVPIVVMAVSVLAILVITRIDW